jgi:hypothetical protein
MSHSIIYYLLVIILSSGQSEGLISPDSKNDKSRKRDDTFLI